MECDIHHKETCQELDPRNLQKGYRFLAAVREICSENTLLHAGENIKIFIPFQNKVVTDTYISSHNIRK